MSETKTEQTDEKAFTLLNGFTDDVAFGLAFQPATNALFLNLISQPGDKPWRSLELQESVIVQDKRGDVYRMVRVR